MALEIERKFLVNNKILLPFNGEKIIQGYFSQSLVSLDNACNNRIVIRNSSIEVLLDNNTLDLVQALYKKIPVECRLRLYNNIGYVTFKFNRLLSQRNEFEYELPYEVVEKAIKTICFKMIEKTRYLIRYNDSLKWEIDVYSNIQPPLIIAEIEIPYCNYALIIPDWIDKEVTGLKEFSNYELAKPVVVL